MAVSGDLLYTASSAGLILYRIGPVQSVPYTAEVKIPNAGDVALVANSITPTPTEIVHGADYDTLRWTGVPAFGESHPVFSWRSTVNNSVPGDSDLVALGGSVDFVSQGTSGRIELPATMVHSPQLVSVSPAEQTVAPGAPASYVVTLYNPANGDIWYNLAAEGVPSGWASIPASVKVSARSTVTVPLVLTPDDTALNGRWSFVVTRRDFYMSSSAWADLVISGQYPPNDYVTRGIVAALSPAQAAAGQGTAADYVVRLTNSGSATDTFSLAATGLPDGFAATLSLDRVSVPPGVSNFRDVRVRLAVPAGAAPGDYPFTITTTSTTYAAVTDTAAGSVTVSAAGVQVSLNPPAGPPGSTFQLTVTNTGRSEDTFDLALADAAAVVATLETEHVTLAPGPLSRPCRGCGGRDGGLGGCRCRPECRPAPRRAC